MQRIKFSVWVVEVFLLLGRLVEDVMVLVHVQVSEEVTLFRAKHRDRIYLRHLLLY